MPQLSYYTRSTSTAGREATYKNSGVCGVCCRWTVVMCFMISSSRRLYSDDVDECWIGYEFSRPFFESSSSFWSCFTSWMSRVFFSCVYRPVFIAEMADDRLES